MAAFAEIYVNRSRGARPLDVTSTISNGAGDIVFRGPEERFTASSPAGYRASWPLGNVGPGAYVLSVEAWDGERRPRVRREIPFRVR